MSEDIKFFPATEVKKGHLGNGYLTSGVLKTSFSVWQTDKSENGFYISLPGGRKKPDGTWINDLEFKNNDSRISVVNQIAPLVATLLGRSGGQAQTQAPSRVAIQNNAAQVGAPF